MVDTYLLLPLEITLGLKSLLKLSPTSCFQFRKWISNFTNDKKSFHKLDESNARTNISNRRFMLVWSLGNTGSRNKRVLYPVGIHVVHSSMSGSTLAVFLAGTRLLFISARLLGTVRASSKIQTGVWRFQTFSDSVWVRENGTARWVKLQNWIVEYSFESISRFCSSCQFCFIVQKFLFFILRKIELLFKSVSPFFGLLNGLLLYKPDDVTNKWLNFSRCIFRIISTETTETLI